MINALFFIIPSLIGFFFAMNMGGSGVSPAFSMAYHSNWLNKKLIPVLFGVFVFIGALFSLDKVDFTLSRGIIPSGLMKITVVTIIMIASSVSLLIANILRVPQSTSQVVVFSILGVALYYRAVKYDKFFYEISPLWITLPLVMFILLYLFGKYGDRCLRKKIYIPHKCIASKIVRIGGIAAGCYVAFALGTNNIANVLAPLLTMFANELRVEILFQIKNPIVFVTLLISSLGFGLGAAVFGKKTMETAGKEITSITPLASFSISGLTASVLFVLSVCHGLPISLVQMHIAAIIGYASGKNGIKSTFKTYTIRKILWVWLAAPITSMAITLFLLLITEGFSN